MEAKDSLSLFNELTTQESATVSGGGDYCSTKPTTTTTTTTTTTATGGTTVNFDLNSYLFTIGAGALFGGGLTTNVVNIAFTGALFTKSN
ncbi:MAG: hypothetical protein DSM106950_30955 [Stigonema ocellatum SAG 48.90 = DSM 106950]|nr:hypothetical protein [Stigonema ocellatum SAG 48.90 = DSM 106950]